MELSILYSTILVILFARNSDAIASKTNSVNLNYSLPLNRFIFLGKNRSFLHKYKLNESSHYSIKLPGDWWNVSDSYTAQNGIKLKLFAIPERKELKQKKS
ncbi:MAG: hypothetical protein CVV24_10330 [Ignavibacteriae bacterium HGW-Ignavibacteriae-3]|nr:MAG: hypothetical protein CVV24_10330 [Ignavibacteriae bacterium HGW-Ignavibacteriae-3]